MSSIFPLGENPRLRMFCIESLAIEGIMREPTDDEVDSLLFFLCSKHPGVNLIRNTVKVWEPTAELRDRIGMDVMVSNHTPIAGGRDVGAELQRILNQAVTGHLSPFQIYTKYQHLHPFMDCNGRSGRMLWLWCKIHNDMVRDIPSFLESFHYDALADYDRRVKHGEVFDHETNRKYTLQNAPSVVS